MSENSRVWLTEIILKKKKLLTFQKHWYKNKNRLIKHIMLCTEKRNKKYLYIDVKLRY